ncbi:unnamed protein product [Phaedon cochleariae]|uniref:Adenylate kinase n=1 Tax=Phaedon cochleariae TaxID=80249 RepID=A0A9P0DYI0_PHACE|nr:unnamed protein product [Phaedon cochleariae]
MGNIPFSCVSAAPSTERVQYDMTPIQNKNLPMIWLAGQKNTGKKTHGNLIKEKYDLEVISISELLRQEAMNDTKRGCIVKEALDTARKINDTIVIDLLKESLLNSNDNIRGFLISNFPKNAKQADMFLKEIGNVNFIFYFYSDTPLLIDRAKEKSDTELNEDNLKKDIANANRDMKVCLGKFALKIESINTSSAPEDVFPKVENALIRRLSTSRPIATESDYVRPQEKPEEKEAEQERGDQPYEEIELADTNKREGTQETRDEYEPEELEKIQVEDERINDEEDDASVVSDSEI